MTVPTDTPRTDGAPDPEEGEWHHNVTHRCPQMGAHTFDRLPIPCEQCTSVEQLTRSIPWQESYFFSRPLRSAAAAGLRVVPEDLNDARIADSDARQYALEDLMTLTKEDPHD